MDKDENDTKNSFNPSEVNKERLMDRIRESVKKDITSLEEKIKSQMEEYKAAPDARQSWSDTSRSQIEGIVTGLNQQLNKRKKTLETLSGFQNTPAKDTVSLWSFVKIIETEEKTWFLIAPEGGKEIQINNHTIYLLSPISPVGKALINHKAGEIIEVKTPGGIRKLKIEEVK